MSQVSMTQENNVFAMIKSNNQLESHIKELEATIVSLSLENMRLKREQTNNGILFCDFLVQWLVHHKGKVEDTTFDGYELVLKTHLYPYFKDKKLFLSALTSSDIQEYYEYKLAQGLSPNTIHKHHANIHRALRYACSQGYIEYNVAGRVDLPKKVKFTASYYTLEDMVKVLEDLKQSPIYVAVLLAAILGLRRSEIVGLMWDNIDIEAGVLYVRTKAVQYITSQQLHISNKLKTNSSYRQLPIPESLLQYLKKLYIRQKNKFPANSYVCINESGYMLKPAYITARFKLELNKGKFKMIRFHDLRHSCASILYSLGYDLKTIQDWLGHSDISTTANIYVHMMPNDCKRIAKRINDEINMSL